MRNILLFAALLFASCISAEKATNVLKKKGKLAEVCEANYPVRDSIIERTKVDTLRLRIIERITDTLRIDAGKLKTEIRYQDTCNEANFGKPVIDKREIERWQSKAATLENQLISLSDSLAGFAVYHEREIIRASTAQQEIYEQRINDLNRKLDKRKTWLQIGWGLFAALALFLLLLIIFRKL